MVFLNFDFHLIYKRDSDRVEKFRAESELHVCQDNEKKSPARSEFAVLSFKLLFFSDADNSIEKPSQSRNKFLMRVVSATFIFLFLSLFLNFKQVILRTFWILKLPLFFFRNYSIVNILIFLLSFDNRITISAQRQHRHKILLNEFAPEEGIVGWKLVLRWKKISVLTHIWPIFSNYWMIIIITINLFLSTYRQNRFLLFIKTILLT